MEGYLGEFEVDIKDTPYANYTVQDWILFYIGSYGQIDGEHHKLWVMDICAQLIHGLELNITEARWADGTKEYRIRTGEPPLPYLHWVTEQMEGEDGPNTYAYDPGSPP